MRTSRGPGWMRSGAALTKDIAGGLLGLVVVSCAFLPVFVGLAAVAMSPFGTLRDLPLGWLTVLILLAPVLGLALGEITLTATLAPVLKRRGTPAEDIIGNLVGILAYAIALWPVLTSLAAALLAACIAAVLTLLSAPLVRWMEEHEPSPDHQ